MKSSFSSPAGSLGLLLSLLLVLGLSGCPTDDDDTGDDDTGEEASWSYDGDTGPAFWGDLSDEWATCGTGMEQSPIEIPSGVAGDIGLTFDYGTIPLAIFNNGHTIEVEVEEGNGVSDGEVGFDLLQFHFHSLSEHTIDGQHSPIEMHLVHRSDAGQLAVLGVLIDEGDANPAFDSIWSNLPTGISEAATEIAGATVDLAALLPDDLGSYTYDGSLTTPPCTEGVAWAVVKGHDPGGSPRHHDLVPRRRRDGLVGPLRDRRA